MVVAAACSGDRGRPAEPQDPSIPSAAPVSWTFKPGTGLLFFVATLVAGAVGVLVSGMFVSPPSPDAVDSLSPGDLLKTVTIISFCSLFCQGVVLGCMPGWWRMIVLPARPIDETACLACIAQGVLAFIVLLPIVLGLGIAMQSLDGDDGHDSDPIGHQTLRALVDGQASVWFWTTAVLVVLAVRSSRKCCTEGCCRSRSDVIGC